MLISTLDPKVYVTWLLSGSLMPSHTRHLSLLRCPASTNGQPPPQGLSFNCSLCPALPAKQAPHHLQMFCALTDVLADFFVSPH